MRILVAESDMQLANALPEIGSGAVSVELISGTQVAQRFISERACDIALLDLALHSRG